MTSKKQKLQAGFRHAQETTEGRADAELWSFAYKVHMQLMHMQFLHCGKINILIPTLNLTHHPISLLPNCPITFKVMPPKFFKPHTSTYMLIIKQDRARSRVLPWSTSLTESTALFRVSFSLFWIGTPS